ncbi:MAG: 16S rRNA (cytosine(1402)-N(4))-methyltransferase RsmH [Acidobacteria bacterium]|nr:16S rRNA (cytosine(1402)-N(4))-methyltransferase RsmH [Acidobacteriota bacterium]
MNPDGDAHPPHTPVLGREATALLVPEPGPRAVVDCTVGAGGHAVLALEAMGPEGRLLGIDRDAEALAAARDRLAPFGDRVRLVMADFRDLEEIVNAHGWGREAGGVLYDLGVSSMQLDRPERGFSYRRDAPLDMRMDATRRLTAADVVNTYSKQELTRILREYGEERWASRIAEFIVNARRRKPLSTTADLVDVIRAAVPSAARRGGPHPARRTFQALRIEVNGELDALAGSLPQAVSRLAPGARVVALSCHSLEDRIVKRALAGESRGASPRLRVLTRRPLRPGPDELCANPRASAAKLRAAERLAAPPEVPEPPDGWAA